MDFLPLINFNPLNQCHNKLPCQTINILVFQLPYTSREVKKADARIQAKRQEIEKYQRYKMKLHEDYTDGLLSREDYMASARELFFRIILRPQSPQYTNPESGYTQSMLGAVRVCGG